MGQFLHKFDTESAFSAAYNGNDYHEPWVSLVDENGQVDYNKHVVVINSLPLYHGNEYYMDIPLVQEGGVPVFEYLGNELSNDFFDGYEAHFRIKKEFCGNISFEGGGYGYYEDSLHPDCYLFYAANSGWRDTTIRIELDPNSNLEEAKIFDTRFDAD